MNILIAGCGDVGGRLAKRFLLNGCRVWGIRRNVARLPPGVQPLALDLVTDDLAPHLPEHLDMVFYTASAGGRDESAYRRAYFQGPNRLLAALTARNLRPKRVFFTSSTSVFGQADGSWVDESSPTNPTSFTGQLMLEGERHFLDSAFAATAVRFSGIYGPGRTWLIRTVKEGRPCPTDPPRYSNRIHVEDAAAVLHYLTKLDQPDSVYLASDDLPVPIHTVKHWLAERLGCPLPPDQPGSSGPNKRCRNLRLKATGFRFQYPTFREGYGDMLAAMPED